MAGWTEYAAKTAPWNLVLHSFCEALDEAGSDYSGDGQDGSCPVPEHGKGGGDPNASFGVAEGKTQPIVVSCQAGDSKEDICDALGVDSRVLSYPIHYAFPFENENGEIEFWEHRTEFADGSKETKYGPTDSSFFSRKQGTSIRDKNNVLYATPRLLEAKKNSELIIIVEGPKKAQILENLGFVATAQRGGASQKWLDEFTELLIGVPEVWIIADNDKAGYDRALRVARALQSVKIGVKVFRSKTEGRGDDLVDHLKAGGVVAEGSLRRVSPAELRERAEAPELAPEEPDEAEPSEEDDLWPPAKVPMDVAYQYVSEFFTEAGLSTLQTWQGNFYQRRSSNRYNRTESASTDSHLRRTLHKMRYETSDGAAPWPVNTRNINEVINALKAITYLDVPPELAPPFWIDSLEPATGIVSFRNGNLNLFTNEFTDPTPNLFNVFALPYDFTSQATEPTRYLRLLNEYWPEEPEMRALWQEVVGYILSGSNDLKRLFILYGTPNSGKSTLQRLLTALIGRENIVSPRFADLGGPFGLDAWRNKTLAILSDTSAQNARDASKASDLLKFISGGDTVDIQRKGRDTITSVALGTRIMFVTNDLPRIPDPSGALANRYLPIHLHQTFEVGVEPDLDIKLENELPGIVLWALEGMRRVLDQHAFTEPQGVLAMREELREASSDAISYVKERLTLGPNYVIDRNALAADYLQFLATVGVAYSPSHKQIWADLRSAGVDLVDAGWHHGGRKWAGCQLRTRKVKV